VRITALVFAACWLLPALAVSAPGYDAKYNLLLNDDLVGQAFFRARSKNGAYSIEAFTVPFGKMAETAPDHEVLEISEGTWLADGPVPREYVFNLRDGRGDHLFEQIFDWQAGRLRLSYDREQEAAVLEAGTQDRLSYLLRLAEAVRNDRTDLAFAVAEPEATVLMRFRAGQRETLKLPAGTAEAVGVDCFTTGDTPDRVIWIVPEWDYVPALIERASSEGRVRMELVNWEPR
jgi:hypothetical protein